ncbi:MAG: bifunctional regulator KidO [Alphaproteobacteria bacterium]|nr:bifunctional regulator KidO [Alphaproteobacteria bacterium]MBU1517250.1 bifunctional regulator KidO [Alphaproteobacteria bacterium]MBU2093214.1 bifunctional regulator KidO [Alphaproteobacteria bacterium]MBU2153160.1 bifunctional regulator KidO [Alphaproteobacteria bacterium]MBU2307866.1 bifunctional regulator KidO [Alphaproteobacteria bacterium]
MTTPLSKLGLGTSQFGLDQPPGPRGKPREAEARDILSIAGRSGLSVLEVARGSISADTLLRGAMPQPNPFRLTLTAVRPDRGPEMVEAELRAQMLRLGVERVDTIVAPSATDLFSPLGPQMWDRLKALKDQGLCQKIGVPVYASDDPVGVARRFKPDIVQAPASLLDQRLLLDGTLATIAGMGIEVHLRSIFLNGVLFLPPDRAPSHLKAAAGRISRARRLIAEGKSDPLQAALGFALTRPEATHVLVGVTSAAEMSAVVAAAMSPPPDLDWDEMAIDDPDALSWVAA